MEDFCLTAEYTVKLHTIIFERGSVMQQASFESNVTSQQSPVEASSNRETQTRQWLKENRLAIEAYKVKQTKQGKTFSDWADQI